MSCQNCRGFDFAGECPTCFVSIDPFENEEFSESCYQIVDDVLIAVMDCELIEYDEDVKTFIYDECVAKCLDQITGVELSDCVELVFEYVEETLRSKGLNLESLINQAKKRISKNG